MSFETDLATNYQTIRQRLWGKPEPRAALPRIQPMLASPHIVDIDTLTIAEAEKKLPGPKKADAKAIARIIEDEIKEDEEWEGMVTLILKEHGENMRRLRSQHRDTHIVNCRRDVILYLYHNRAWSMPRIGRFMNRDHTSIYHTLNPEVRRNKYRAQRDTAKLAWGN